MRFIIGHAWHIACHETGLWEIWVYSARPRFILSGTALLPPKKDLQRLRLSYDESHRPHWSESRVDNSRNSDAGRVGLRPGWSRLGLPKWLNTPAVEASTHSLDWRASTPSPNTSSFGELPLSGSSHNPLAVVGRRKPLMLLAASGASAAGIWSPSSLYPYGRQPLTDPTRRRVKPWKGLAGWHPAAAGEYDSGLCDAQCAACSVNRGSSLLDRDSFKLPITIQSYLPRAAENL